MKNQLIVTYTIESILATQITLCDYNYVEIVKGLNGIVLEEYNHAYLTI